MTGQSSPAARLPVPRQRKQAKPSPWSGDVAEPPVRGTAGHVPTPFTQFVLKIHSRCNLACSYCYVYEMADTSWRGQPTVMSAETVARTALRVAEHARAHRLAAVTVVLHGGEPLLAPPAFFARLAETFQATVPASTAVSFTVQTNGTLLSPDHLRVFRRHGIRVGVSLDGDGSARRRYADGRASQADAVRGLTLLGSPEWRPLFAGVLAVADIEQDPVATYESLLAYHPPLIDVNLPHAHWSDPPPGRAGASGAGAPYGDWLAAMFDRWHDAPRRETGIRLFEEIVNLLLGGRSRTELVGLTPSTVVVVETDGSIEQVDALKAAYDGAAATGLTVTGHSFDDALVLPSIAARQMGALALAPECQACTLHQVCGGGFYPHRYKAGSGFRNPSVYCPDLMRLILHIRARVVGRLAELGARQ